MLKFSKDFFKDEEREGFLVKSDMKRAWAMQMEILKNIEEVCDRHGINYFSFWGTMLGAVRHKGFVPWDDDMDIMMKREDYEKFVEVAPKELPEGFSLLSIYNEHEWDLATARVTNGFTLSFDENYLKEHYLCPYVCGIDIFPYDYVPDDKETFKEQENFLNGITMVRDLYKERDKQLAETGKYNPEIDKNAERVLRDIEKFFDFEFNRDNNMDNQILCFFDRVCAGYGSPSDKYMTGHIERRAREHDGGRFMIPTFCFDEAIDYPFEEHTLRVPKYYEICLSRCYGRNFMTPVKSGVSAHEYPFYKIQDEKLKDLGTYEMCVKTIENLTILESLDTTVSEYIDDINNKSDNCEISEETEQLRSIISDWKAPDKKVILSCFGTMDFFENEEKCLEKLIDTVSFFKSKSDKICFILIDALYVTDVLARKDIELAKRYIALFDELLNSDWCLVISHDQYNQVVDMCDAYYGSPNEYIKYFQDNKLPIMAMNLDIMNS